MCTPAGDQLHQFSVQVQIWLKVLFYKVRTGFSVSALAVFIASKADELVFSRDERRVLDPASHL